MSPVGLPTGWESDVLSRLGAPVDPTTVGDLDVWQRTEGGSTNNPDDWNPLNTTLREPGSFPTNSVGVQSYPSWAEGLAATVSTLEQPNMAPIASALRTDAAQPAFEAAVNASPWGTHFSGAGSAAPTPAATTTGALSDITGGILGSAFSGFASSLYGIAIKAAIVAAGVGLAVAGAVTWTKSTEAGQDLEHDAGSALPLLAAA